jgi:hypothetical protein
MDWRSIKVATADYDYRAAGLDKCRTVLFPSLADMLAVKPLGRLLAHRCCSHPEC